METIHTTNIVPPLTRTQYVYMCGYVWHVPKTDYQVKKTEEQISVSRRKRLSSGRIQSNSLGRNALDVREEEVSANVSHVRTSHFLFLNVHRYYLDCATLVPFLFCAFPYLIAVVFFFLILLKNMSVQSVRSFREQAGRFVVVVTKQNKTAVTSMWESYFLQFFQKCFILPVGKRVLCAIAIQLSTLQKQC